MPNTNRILLTEQMDALTYIKEGKGSNKHYLGKLAGIGAEFNKPTRNGRRYPLELWQNVEKSDDFIEGMKTKTIFGECDHPEDRIETSIKEIAIALSKFEIRENEGNVYTEFHILDTPNGRILKELLDYGSQIGVSSRGLGDEVVRDGETIIDPETYCFYGFDAVVMPAVKNARPTVTESKVKPLIESFNNEIETANTVAELESIKRTIEKLPELESIKGSIDIKLESLNNVGDNISQKLESDLGKISEENVRLVEEIETLKSKLSANNIRIDRLKKINQEYKTNNKSLRKSLGEKLVYNAELETTVFDNANETNYQSEKLNNAIRIAESRNDRLKEMKLQSENLKSMVDESNEMANGYKKELSESKRNIISLTKDITELQSNVRMLENNIYKLENDNKSLLVTNNKLNEQLKQKSNTQVITEKKSKQVVSSYEEVIAEKNSTIIETLEKYLQTRCSQQGLKIETVKRLLPKDYSIEDIDNVVNELSDRKRRYDSLPFTITQQNVRIVENANLSEEDKQTMTFLMETNNNLR